MPFIKYMFMKIKKIKIIISLFKIEVNVNK